MHAFGAGATEVVHIGQAVMGLGGTIDYLVDAVFNYPTFAEAYKVAALDALNKLRAISAVCANLSRIRLLALHLSDESIARHISSVVPSPQRT